jgi:hypothetical protein
MFVFGRALYIFLWGGLANKRQSCTFNSEYYLRREKNNQNTLNIMFFGANIFVPVSGCMLSFVELLHWSYFQNNVAIFVFCITLCMTRYVER